MNKSIGIIAVLFLAGCTDAEWAQNTSLGQSGRVTCHSGNAIVFDDFSTGKIAKHSESDGFYFVSRTTGRLTEVTGTCTIDYGVGPGPGFKAVRI